MSANRYRPEQAEVPAATARARGVPFGASRVETNLDQPQRRRASSLATIAAILLLPITQAQADSLAFGRAVSNAVLARVGTTSVPPTLATPSVPRRSSPLTVVAGARG